jgi:hypothetical protein
MEEHLERVHTCVQVCNNSARDAINWLAKAKKRFRKLTRTAGFTGMQFVLFLV